MRCSREVKDVGEAFSNIERHDPVSSCAKAERRHTAAEQRAHYRESAEFQTAMELLAGEMVAGRKLPELRAKMSEGSAAALGGA